MAVDRVAVVGPESSGKSALCEMLVAALGHRGVPAALVPEYARDFYRDHPYDPDDLADVAAVAAGQLVGEEAVAATLPDGILVCDTTPLSCRVWAELRAGSVPPEILASDDAARYALHLVTTPDLPWSPDPLRVSPDPQTRAASLRLHLDLLRGQGARVAVIRGADAADRLAAALRAVAAIPGHAGVVAP